MLHNLSISELAELMRMRRASSVEITRHFLARIERFNQGLNALVTVTFVDEKAVTVELPSSVVLKVTDAPEGIRGDSANNVQKPVIMETGITVQVPLFIKTGEKIKLDTRTGKYMERA